MTFINRRSSNLIFPIGIASIAFFYALLLSLRGMPLAEGWYSYYAQCINGGQIVYKDFDYLFPPFYIYFIALFTKIFGYSILCLRLLGAFIFSTISIIFYKIFSYVFSQSSAAICGLISVFYLQSEPVQIFYDYIRFADLFVLLSILFLLKYIYNQKYSTLFIAGIFNSLNILVKQSIGIPFVFFALILLAGTAFVQRKKFTTYLHCVSSYLFGVCIPIAMCCILLCLSNSFGAAINSIFISSLSAKGGFFSILFGWIYRDVHCFTRGFLVQVIIIILSITLFFRNKNKDCQHSTYLSYAFLCISFLLIVFSFISKNFTTVLNEYTKSYPPHRIFVVCQVLFLFFIAYAIHSRKTNKIVDNNILMLITTLGAFISIAFSSGMSGGLVESQTSLGIGIIGGLLLKTSNTVLGRSFKVLVCFLGLIVLTHSFSAKIIHPYNWWGMDEDEYWNCKCENYSIPNIQHIGLSEQSRKAFNAVNDIVQHYSDNGDAIYCFPNIPIFYMLCNRIDPGVKAKVQWFDVVNDNSINNDIDIIRQSSPKVFLIYNTSEHAYSSHESLFREGQISATRKMKNFLFDYADKNGYEKRYIIFSSNNIITIFFKDNAH